MCGVGFLKTHNCYSFGLIALGVEISNCTTSPRSCQLLSGVPRSMVRNEPVIRPSLWRPGHCVAMQGVAPAARPR
ncbi:unnamed protein product [Pleuronectes platessa]|uniref:Uncharacterized protein n=1 Tax=Pleuronectes platessa TaxID=8262 RepID=A0A9N7Z729_PLEPL|nr:unnamed protein product [Pleuronectes platessa]